MTEKIIIKKSIIWPDKGQVYIRGIVTDDGHPVIEFSRSIPFGFEVKRLQLSKKEFTRFFEVFKKVHEAIEK